jgi:hypothetical protein
MAEPPPRAQSPTSSDRLSVRRREHVLGSKSPAGIALANAIAAMNQVGDGAEDEYQRTLEELRRQADAVAVEIARASSECKVQDYPDRWALVHIAAELRHRAALPYLRNIVETPIPPERSKDPHSFSTVAEETILRTTAVEGVGELAREQQNRDAAEALWEFLKQPSLSIRRAAVQSLYRSAGSSKRTRDRIAALLPEEQRFLLDLKPVDVSDVPQIARPQRHLSEAGREGRTEAPPAFGGETENDEREEGPTGK